MSLFITLFFGLLATGIVIVLLWNLNLSRLYRLLNAEMPDKFEAMGKPNLSSIESPGRFWAQLRFILKREYEVEGSFTMNQVGDRLYRLFWAFLCVMGLLLLSFLSVVLYSQTR